ncbi:MAG: MerR family transcriptional regulator, partial [Xanthomonadales bacterium]|nr:MerR family transcriptional regulator [Xanthomonadales bacterium]
MRKTVPIIDDQTPGLYPIRTVSELTGVNAITLRSWENRYGLIEPVRKASGHRLYTQEHIDLVNRIVNLLDRNMRIGQVKSYLENESGNRDLADTSPRDESDVWQRLFSG